MSEQTELELLREQNELLRQQNAEVQERLARLENPPPPPPPASMPQPSRKQLAAHAGKQTFSPNPVAAEARAALFGHLRRSDAESNLREKRKKQQAQTITVPRTVWD